MYNENQNDEQNNNQNPNDKNKGNKNGLIAAIIASFAILLFVCWIRDEVKSSTNEEITYDAFLEMVEKEEVESVEFSGSIINIIPKNQEDNFYKKTYYTGYLKDEAPLERLNNANIEYHSKIDDGSSSIIEFLMWNIFPFFLIFGTMWLLFRPMFKGGGMMGVGKSNAKVYVEKETGVTFQDVAGQEEAKDSLTELVDFLHNPAKYAKIGAKLPKGALLVGPPGTG